MCACMYVCMYVWTTKIKVAKNLLQVLYVLIHLCSLLYTWLANVNTEYVTYYSNSNYSSN